MENKNKNQQHKIWLLVSALTVLAYLLFLSLRHDFWYDLNDDVMIKNITSGIYTGTPEFHNIQMQYPLSLILALLYRLSNRVAWYALFLIFAQMLSIILILCRTSEMFLNKKSKVAGFTTTAAILFLLLTKHMVIYQYTVSCAFLSGAAAFLILTERGGEQTYSKGVRGILTAGNITAVIMIFLSFLIRSEMMLLTAPLVMLALLFRFVSACTADIGIANKHRIINTFKKYLTLFILAVVGTLLLAGWHRIGYAAADWKTFNAFFDARTELYDFNTIPAYDENEAFYREIGMDESAQILLENYNFGLSDALDAQVLDQVASYSKSLREVEQGSVLARLKRAFSDYGRRIIHPLSADEDKTDGFWKMTVLVIYLLALAFGYRHHILWKLVLLFACRTTLWMYIIYRNRVPVRITHSLYFVELMVLFGLLLNELSKLFREKFPDERKIKMKRYITMAIAIPSAIVFAVSLPFQSKICKHEEMTRLQNSQPYDTLFSYMEDHPNQFYYIDVYSWVPYTEKLFGKSQFKSNGYLKAGNNNGMNYDLMGGWATFSPFACSKIRTLNADSMKEALLKEEVFYVQRVKEAPLWLESFYQDRGYDIVIELFDTVGDFEIYWVKLSGV